MYNELPECSAKGLFSHTAMAPDNFCLLRSACSFPRKMSPACFSLHNSLPARLLLDIERKMLSLGFLYHTRCFLRKRPPSSFQDHMKELIFGFSRSCTSYLSHPGPYSTHLINVSILMALLSFWKLHCWCVQESSSEQPGVFLLGCLHIDTYTHRYTASSPKDG